MENLYQKIGFTRLALILMFLVGVLELLFGEKYGNASGGILFDGTAYINAVKNLEELLNSRTINEAIGGKINRFFPSILVHYGMRLVGADIQNHSHIFWAFIYHNIVWTLIGTWAWAQIGKILNFAEKNKWIGLVFLFGNVAFLKVNLGYIPVMTDTAAFNLGLLLIYFYLHPNFYTSKIGLCIVGLIGAFTWQTVQIYAYILLFFPNSLKIDEKPNKWLNIGVYSLPLLLFLYGFLAMYTEGGMNIFNKQFMPSWGQVPLYARGFWLTVAFAAIFTFFFYKELYQNWSLNNWKTLIPTLERILPVFLLHGLVSLLAFAVSPNTNEPLNNIILGFFESQPIEQQVGSLKGIGFTRFFFYPNAIHYPAEIIVAHGIYFGLAYVLIFVFFPQIAQRIRQLGIGMVLLCTATFIMLCYPESRIHTPFVPFVVLFVILFMNENTENWHIKHYFVLILGSLFASKVWLRFGESIGTVSHIDQEVWLRFFMNFGGWINVRWYAIQGFVFFIFVAWFFIHRKQLLYVKK